MTRTFLGVLLVMAVTAVWLGIGWAQQPAVEGPRAVSVVAEASAVSPPVATSSPTTANAPLLAVPPAHGVIVPAPAGVPPAPPSGVVIMGGGGAAVPYSVPAGAGFVSTYHAASPERQRLSTEMTKAQQEEQTLTGKYAATTNEPERAKLKESLAKVLDQQFDLQQKMRKEELEPIEARVKRLRELIDKRAQARKTIVEKRLEQILREAEGMGWTSSGEPTALVPPAPSNGTPRYGMSAVYQPTPDGKVPALNASGSAGAVSTGVIGPLGGKSTGTVLTRSAPDTAKPVEIKIYTLANRDVASLIEAVTAMPFVKEKRVQVAFDERTNSLAASGPKEDLHDLEALVLHLDVGPAKGTGVEAKAAGTPGTDSSEQKAPVEKHGAEEEKNRMKY